MRHNYWIVRIVGIALIVAIFLAGFGSAVWQPWNLLMPKIFALPALRFWQAVGLLSLSWILFGSWAASLGPTAIGAVECASAGRRCRPRSARAFARVWKAAVARGSTLPVRTRRMREVRLGDYEPSVPATDPCQC